MPTTMATVAPRAAICASARSTKITPRSTTCTPRYACMLGAGRDAGARLDVADDVQVEMFGEIGPGAMIGDDLTAVIRGHLRKPLLVGVFQALFEVGVALREISSVAGPHFAELVGDTFG